MGFISAMSSVKEIEKAIQGLSRSEIQELHDWIANYLEDELEMTPEFEASIERGKKDIADGRIRVRKL